MGNTTFRHALVLGCCLALVPALGIAAPKKKAPKAPATITVINQRAVAMTEIVFSDGQGAEIGLLSTSLETGKRASVKLTKADCEVMVTASFADEGVSENTIDVCKDKTIRLTD
jgi:hypothetical protein